MTRIWKSEISCDCDTTLHQSVTPVTRDTWPGNSPGPSCLVTALREFPCFPTLVHRSHTKLSSHCIAGNTSRLKRKRGRYQKPAWLMFLFSCARVLVWVWVLWACLFFPVTKSWHAPSETLSGWRQTRCDTWHGHDTRDTWRGDTWHVTRPCTLPLSSKKKWLKNNP